VHEEAKGFEREGDQKDQESIDEDAPLI